MNKILLSSLFLLIFTTFSFTGENGKGGYIGLAYGTSEYATTNERLTIKDKSNSTYKLYTGNQFNQIAGVELSYTDYGEYTYSDTRSVQTQAIGVSGNIGYTFLSGQLRPFCLIGLSSLQMEQNGTQIFEDNSNIAYAYGLGLEYSPKLLHGLGVRLLWDANTIYTKKSAIVIGEDEQNPYTYNMYSLALQYRF